MPVNIVIDLAMLVAMALASISGFILEVVIPSPPCRQNARC